MTRTKITFGRRVRSVIVVLFYIAIPIVIALGIAIPFWIFYFVMPGLEKHRVIVEDPVAEFQQYTGLTWPSTGAVISVGDSHGGLHYEGELHVVANLDRDTLDQWLEASPPWEQHEWKRGPVPDEVGAHCFFGTRHVASVNRAQEPGAPIDELARERILISDDVWYCAAERCCSDSLTWHSGNLLVIDLAAEQVWLSVWDY